VGVRILLSPDALELQVVDAGAPFQPPQAETPDPERERHWGLILLQQLQEQHGWCIAYESRGAAGNVLRIRHSLVQESPPGSPLSPAP
jgi:hypothetical protein